MAEADRLNPQPPSAGPSSGRCIVVFGTKGGVGKTAVATNVAVAMAQRLGQPVCLVDLDMMGTGDLAKMLGLNPQRAVADLAAHLSTPRRTPLTELPLESVLLSHSSGVHVVPCLLNPRQGHAVNAALLDLLFATLKARYGFIVVDGGKGLTDPLITAFDQANLILLVATPDIVSLYQTKWAMSLIESLLFPPSMVKAILNRAESRGGVGSQDARMAIPCDIVGEIPSDGRSMGTAINQGEPVVTLYGFSKVSGAFRKIADTLVDQPSLYVSHQEIPRHHRQGDGAPVAPSGFALSGSARLYTPGEGAMVHEPEDEIVLLKQRIHERLVDELDLKKVDLALFSNQAHLQEMRSRCERVIANILAKELGGIISSHEIRSRLVKEILDEALGLGPLEELLDDPTITDILVNNKDQIYVERGGKLELTRKKFISNDQVRAVIERIVAPLGRRIDEANPTVDARLPDGSRVNAVIPPLSVKGPVLSIRKFARTRYTHEDLIKFGSLTEGMAQVIRACVLSRKNMMISGGTGSGKTTMLNIISAFIPENERIISIEDAAELQLAQTHWVSLEARPSNVEGKGQITIRDLFHNALRMRPDRILIGECRGAETLDMLQAMNTGHEGSMTTIHANSPKDVVSRLDSMVLMSNVDLPIRAIREMVASALHLVIHTARLSDGSRKIISISELVDLVDGTEIVFRDLFQFRQTGVTPDGAVVGQFIATGQLPSFFNELRVKGVELDESLFASPSPATAVPH